MQLSIGDFVIIEWIENITKVQGDIVYILYADQIKHLRQNNLWYVTLGIFVCPCSNVCYATAITVRFLLSIYSCSR